MNQPTLHISFREVSGNACGGFWYPIKNHNIVELRLCDDNGRNLLVYEKSKHADLVSQINTILLQHGAIENYYKADANCDIDSKNESIAGEGSCYKVKGFHISINNITDFVCDISKEIKYTIVV